MDGLAILFYSIFIVVFVWSWEEIPSTGSSLLAIANIQKMVGIQYY